MAAGNGIWGIEVGQCSMKAIKLREVEGGKVELVAFDLIEHPKLLSQPDADPDEIIRAAVEKFISRNDWQKDQFVIGVPGQQTFARFCKLPPVEQKKIPDIVKFEASQQIPFEMSDVVWDYEVFQEKDSPDVEVGIFAMRKDLIKRYLEQFAALGVAPIAIQTIPSALYNMCRFDEQGAGDDGATVVVDVGALNTDLIIAHKSTAWTRNIPLGGNTFTEALVKAFKLSFAKAEQLKRTAAESKHARQIFQAMRPVFADLVAEIQRSLGFYSSTHREVELKGVLVCGNAFRLTGLEKYLETNLTIGAKVSQLGAFRKLVQTANSNAPQFADNILSFGPAYGLAVQGLGLAPISANLLPPELARIAMWKRKQWHFVGAAACLAVAALMPWMRISLDSAALGSESARTAQNETRRIVAEAQDMNTKFSEAQGGTAGQEENKKKLLKLQEDRTLVARLYNIVLEALPTPDPIFLQIHSPEEFKEKVLKPNPAYKRTNRKEVLIDALRVKYVPNIDAYEPPADMGSISSGMGASPGMPAAGVFGLEGGGGPRGARNPAYAETPSAPTGEGESGDSAATGGFYVQFSARILYGETQAPVVAFLTDQLLPRIRQLAKTEAVGWYIPDTDEKNTEMTGEKRNLRFTSPVPVVPPTETGGAGRFMPSAVMPPPGTPNAAEPVVVRDPDPLTGEERATDWRVTIGFKVKMGNPPAAAPADANGQPANP